MKRLSYALGKFEEFVMAVSLGGASVIIILSVIMRYIFNDALSWAEEGAILLLIFSALVGASLTLREREHVGIDILSLAVRDRGKKVLAFVSMALTATYCAVLGFFGWVMVSSPSAINAVTPALQLPLWTVQLAIPLGLTLMLFRAIEAIVHVAKGDYEKDGTAPRL